MESLTNEQQQILIRAASMGPAENMDDRTETLDQVLENVTGRSSRDNAQLIREARNSTQLA